MRLFGVETKISLSHPQASSLETSTSPYAPSHLPFPPPAPVRSLLEQYPTWLTSPSVTFGLFTTETVDDTISIQPRLPFSPALLTFRIPTTEYTSTSTDAHLKVSYPVTGGMLSSRPPTGRIEFTLMPKQIQTAVKDYSPTIITGWFLRRFRCYLYSWTQGLIHRYVMVRFHHALWKKWMDSSQATQATKVAKMSTVR